MLQGYHQSTAPKSASHSQTEQDSPGGDPTLESPAYNRDALLKLAEGLVQFPKTPEMIVSCQEAVYSFGAMLHDVFDTPIARWEADEQTQNISRSDILAIKEAHDFAVLSSSLFKHLVEECPCKSAHWADIHLSGFSQGHMDMSIRACHKICNFSTCLSSFCCLERCTTDSTHRFPPSEICPQVPVVPDSQNERRHVSFRDAAIWETRRTLDCDFNRAPPKLSEMLKPSANPMSVAMWSPTRRKWGVHLARSMLRLFDSSWIQDPWTGNSILLHNAFPGGNDSEPMGPHISCELSIGESNARANSEIIAALGIIIMELSAGEAGAWDEDEDTDLESGVLSFQVRLGRMLYQWKEKVRGVHRVISQACHDFESLVQAVDHPDVKPELKGAAVVYKCIFEPLRNQWEKESEAERQSAHSSFRGSRATGSITAAQAAKVVLFDDTEVPESNEGYV